MEKIGRNDMCNCESQKKYKKCCLEKDELELRKKRRTAVFNRFSVIEDPRDNRGKRYLLMDLFVMSIYGILNGYDDFVNLAYFLEVNEDYFKKLLLIDKTPSHDCLSDLFSMIDTEKFTKIFIEWTKSLLEEQTGYTMAIDGKAVKSARDKINSGNTPYILSAYLTDLGLSVGQVDVDKKSNEITAIPKLLDLLNIKGNYITIDAMETQESITRKIVSLEGHYLLKVKGNQKQLQKDVRKYFDEHLDNKEDLLVDITGFERNHGREEHREYYVSHDPSCITDKNKWDTVKALGMVRVYRIIGDKLNIEDHFYIMDTKISIMMFKKAIRNHWNIECGLHWRLDVILNEDHSRSRKGESISNLALMRKIIFNLVRLDTSFGKITFKKKLVNYRSNFSKIENLIFNVLPEIA